MRYLIDGYNFLFCGGHELIDNLDFEKGCHDLKQSRTKLICFLTEALEGTNLQVSLVFDSPKNPGSGHYDRYCPLEVLYTPKGLSADAWIIETSRGAPSHTFCVVTQDKRLQRNLIDARIDVLSVKNFLNLVRKTRLKNVTKTKKQPTIPSSRWRDHYIEIFEKRYRSLDDFLD